jgi:hypothetical protein
MSGHAAPSPVSPDPVLPPGARSLPPAVSAIRVGADPEGKGWRIGVVAKRTWTVRRGRCELAPEQVPLVEEPSYDEVRAVLVHDADVILNRPKADVIVDGHVYPPEGRTPFDFQVQVGRLTRQARAFGARRVAPTLTGAGAPRFSPPERIDEIALGWQSAYGGVDLAAREDIGDPFEEALKDVGGAPDPRFGLFAYPRNPVGRGYLIEPTATAFERCELPLIEDLSCLLTPETLVMGDFVRWPEGPAVAGFGWLSYGYFPRSAVLGSVPLVYDGERIQASAFHEVRLGEIHQAAVRGDRPLAERLGIGVTQSSAIGMRSPEIAPGDPVLLRGLHPREREWAFSLPSEVPRMHIRFAGEKPTAMPPPRIRTVFLQPDEDRLTLVWTAELPVSAPPGPARLEGIEHAVLW